MVVGMEGFSDINVLVAHLAAILVYSWSFSSMHTFGFKSKY